MNYRIEANQLRVINHEGKQLGVMDKNAALNLARDQELDLVLIAPKAQPPVAKIINFKKFLYQEEKKEKEARKGIKKSTTKDLKLSLFIGPADLERMINKGREFIEAGNQLRLNLMLKGREMAKKPMAFELIKRFIEKLGDVNVSKTPKMEGRVLRAVVAKRK
ncbi:translation initiation factor IF-3 [Patescibacteria group bacterium]|nr:translation initiation factor IF-3 [Patescibacteria group bacterium]MCL5091880.1 translation initiation factor IF-3 [Patescibacteria group bacterium]